MSKTIQAQLLTPNGSLFEGDATGVLVPGAQGAFEILDRHAPIVSVLGIGQIRVTLPDGEQRFFAVSGGFVEASNNVVTVLAEKALSPEEINLAETSERLKDVKAALKETVHGRDALEKEVQELNNLIRLSQSG